MGCKVESFPFKYLGLPLCDGCVKVLDWDLVVERFKKRLSSWVGGFLSFGGKFTLISAVLANLPTYYLSMFRIPVLVASKLERIMSRFLWKGGKNVLGGFHMVA